MKNKNVGIKKLRKNKDIQYMQMKNFGRTVYNIYKCIHNHIKN